MRLLKIISEDDFVLSEDLADDETPPYAILSHTWGEDDDEVTFEDLKNGSGKGKTGYEKLQFCGRQARRDGLLYFWIDTCCINKGNRAEFLHAIRSMFRWYRNATRCYVHLSDVSNLSVDEEHGLNLPPWEPDFRKSRWFTRGWTLQELLAPSSVEFFSKERERLGDKGSLAQKIHEITGIPEPALKGVPLFQFSVHERLLWKDSRHTKLEEDKAYSLLGIFGVDIVPIYGEGVKEAFRRLLDEISKLEKCTQDLHLTDPRDDKKRIEETRGGLLEGSYRWILQNSEFQQWRNSDQDRLLWIKGDPGKGKTMLLCGIADELKRSMANTDLLSYFFCQATDSRINNATAMLRGILYMLAVQQPSLIRHVQRRHDHAGKVLFEDANAWVALSEIFTNVMEDPNLNNTYIIIDALDECIASDLPKLLEFIIQKSASSSRVKWIVSSRNSPDVGEWLDGASHKVELSLDLNTPSISMAVGVYIRHTVLQLAHRKKYDHKTQDAVLSHLSSNANDTFLWVALVCRNLEKISRWDVLAKLNAFPPGLDSLYGRMMQQIRDSGYASLCKQILALVAVVYRPITLKELTSLVDILQDMANDLESIQDIIGLCASFLTIREGTIYFVHQSAKEFLFTNVFDEIFPSGKEEAHYTIFSRSLQAMSRTLQRDIYGLCAPGYPAEQIKPPNPDPLASSCYSCIFWIDHLCDWNPDLSINRGTDLQNEGAIHEFLRKKYLYWLEALSICKSISKGIVSIKKLETLIQGVVGAPALIELVLDARRFLLYHKRAIENSPLQVYSSALVFSPARSPIRRLFMEEQPKWITIKPDIGDNWSAFVQSLEGHSDFVGSVAFSHDSIRLASGSFDGTVKIWDTISNECLQTLKGHESWVRSVAFSHDSSRLASASFDGTVKIWDTRSSECLLTLWEDNDAVFSVDFSSDSVRLASGSESIVKVWDTRSGECLQTLKGHSDTVWSVAFSPNSTQLASASNDCTIKIWDSSSGECLRTITGHGGAAESVVFSHDSAWLASASGYRTAKIWDVSSGECIQTLETKDGSIRSVAISPDSRHLASASDSTVKVWDTRSGECLQTLKGHSSEVWSVAFSPDSTRLASASNDRTVKIWDLSSITYPHVFDGSGNRPKSVVFSGNSVQSASAPDEGTVKIQGTSGDGCLGSLQGHSRGVNSVTFSHDLTRFASASDDCTIRIWDTSSHECLQTLEGHSGPLNLVVFSHDSTRLASASHDCTVKIWDSNSCECLQTLKGHTGTIWSVAFSHDSSQLTSGSHDNTAKVWNVSNGECLQTLEGHSSAIYSVSYSHNSAWLASASYDKTVKVWDADGGKCLQTFEGHSSWVRSVAFYHNAAQLVSSSDDGTVKIWDLINGGCLHTFTIDKALHNISMDTVGHNLHSSIGNIALNVLTSNNDQSITGSRDLQYQGWALSSDGLWITHNSENTIWLPSDYLPSCSVVSGNTICIGVGSGEVWTFKFNNV